jgi:hypothetical protein
MAGVSMSVFKLTPEAVTGITECGDVLEHLLDEVHTLASALFDIETCTSEDATKLELAAMLQRKSAAARSIYCGALRTPDLGPFPQPEGVETAEPRVRHDPRPNEGAST